MSLQSIKDFSNKLRELPTTVAIKVAAAVAPALTEAAQATFNAGEDAYGIGWTPLADGKRATLKKTGGIFRGVYYVATGTKLRVKIAVPYGKYQLGRRPAFPRQNAPLPKSYIDALTKVTNEVIKAEMAR